jgi:hypothetical protein
MLVIRFGVRRRLSPIASTFCPTNGAEPKDATGSVDAQGTAHVRQRSSSCSHNFAWLKQPK